VRPSGVALYNYYPDHMALARGTEIELRIPDYHSVFDTKRYWDRDTGQHVKVRRVEFYGYDPEIHRRFELDERDLREYVSG